MQLVTTTVPLFTKAVLNYLTGMYVPNSMIEESMYE